MALLEEQPVTKEYDFLTLRSFPSSAKIVSSQMGNWWVRWGGAEFPWFPGKTTLPVNPSSKLRVEIFAKQENVNLKGQDSALGIYDYAGRYVLTIRLPLGTYGWTKFTAEALIPSDVTFIRMWLAGGNGTTWYDDLKIYMDDVLIYSDDFSNWDPLIGAGVGAPIGGVAGYLLKEPLGPMVSEAIGAVLGGALGGGIGLLTGLGIIPVPQIPIPALGAAPEGPGAPARLGKYLITG